MSMVEAVLRSDVYAAINAERNFQDAVWPVTTNAPHPHRHNVDEEILLLQRYTTAAIEAWTVNVGDRHALDVVRKIAAIAVRCMENHGIVQRGEDL